LSEEKNGMSKSKKGLIISIVAFLVISSLTCLIFIDRWLTIRDEAEKVDAIICLGGGSGERLQKVVKLYKKGYAPIVILTASEISDPEVREFAVDLKRRFLLHKGIPSQSIISEFESDNTYFEVKNITDFMISNNLHSAIVVSDAYHMRRVSCVFRKIFRNNVKLLYVPAEAKWAEGHWWGNEKSLVYVFNEVLKLGYYSLKY